jgi:uncharacterized protein with HEPN domain
MPREPHTYLWDVQRAAALISEFITGCSLGDYRSNHMLKSAVERQFEIIGEALYQLSRVDPELAARIPNLGRLVAFRNILIHGYAVVDDEIVWGAATDRLPALVAAISKLLED